MLDNQLQRPAHLATPRRIGLYREQYEKEGYNPVTQQITTTTRRRVKVDLELLMKEEYVGFLKGSIWWTYGYSVGGR